MLLPAPRCSATGVAPGAFAALLDRFDRPQEGRPPRGALSHRRSLFVLVGGTNGKGTMATLLAELLRRCGLRVGLFTSPHFVDVRERFVVNGAPIDSECLHAIAEEVAGRTDPTTLNWFQYLTLIGLLAFRQTKTDITILEVGLGGRLDPTNVVDPVLSIITSVDLDHTERLGETLEAILMEKLPIGRTQRPLFFLEQRPALRSVAQRWCKAHDVHLQLFDGEAAGQDHQYYRQRYAAAAFEAARLLPVDPRVVQIIDDAAVREELQETLVQFPLVGRMQRLANLTLDIAHNDAALAWLAASMPQPFDLIIVKPQQRRWETGFAALAAKASVVYCPRMEAEADHLVSSDTLCATVSRHNSAAVTTTSVAEALRRCQGRPTLVCGSARLVGRVLEQR